MGTGIPVVSPRNHELPLGVRAGSPDAWRQGVYLHPDGAVNAASFAPVGNPVAPGEFVTLFGMSLAPAIEAGTSGQAYTGGKEAQVQFERLAPNFAGLYQLNVLAPDGVPAGDWIPPAFETTGAFHDQVDIAVTR